VGAGSGFLDPPLLLSVLPHCVLGFLRPALLAVCGNRRPGPTKDALCLLQAAVTQHSWMQETGIAPGASFCPLFHA
jgi:hypothetical protein